MIRYVAFAMVLVGSSVGAEPLGFHNGRLFISATVNGVETEALLDSGAESTLVDPDLAAKARLPDGDPQVIKGSGGSAQARIVEGVTIGALGAEIHPEVVVILDMTDLSKRLIKRPTHAIVGRELFDAARLRIDIAGGDIRIVTKDAKPSGKKLPLIAHAGIEAVPVVVNGVPVQAEFDLGNGSDVLISRDLARKLKLRIQGKKKGGGIGGAIEHDVVRIPVVSVAGARFRNVTATIDDQPNHNDLNIGTSVLKHFLITTDFKEGAVWLEPRGSIGR